MNYYRVAYKKGKSVDTAIVYAKTCELAQKYFRSLHPNTRPISCKKITGQNTIDNIDKAIEEHERDRPVFVTTAARKKFSRRGTNHVHPPGPRKCPKCGV
jgi:hypothetical protein